MKASLRSKPVACALSFALVAALVLPIGAFANQSGTEDYGSATAPAPRETDASGSSQGSDSEGPSEPGLPQTGEGSGAVQNSDTANAASPLSAGDIVISESGITTVSLSGNSYTLSGAQSGSGTFDAASSIVADAGVSGNVILEGRGSLDSMLLRSPDGQTGMSLTFASGSDISCSGTVSTMSLSLFGALSVDSDAVMDMSPEAYSAIIDVHGTLYMEGGTLHGRAGKDAQSQNFLLVRGDDQTAYSPSMIAENSEIDIVSSAMVEQVLFGVDNQDIFVDASTITLVHENGSPGVGFLVSGVGDDEGTIALDGGSHVEAVAPDGMAIIWKTADIGKDATVVCEGSERGALIHYLLIGEDGAPSNAHISAKSSFVALEVLRGVEIYGAGKTVPSIETTVVDDASGSGSVGAVIRRPLVHDTKIQVQVTSDARAAVGLKVYDTHNGYDGTPDPDARGYFENSTLVASAPSAGMQFGLQEELPFVDCDVQATAQLSYETTGTVGASAGMATPNATLRFIGSTAYASGGNYGLIGTLDDGDFPGELSSRVYAEKGSDLTFEGSLSGLAVNRLVEANSGSTITGIARTVNPLGSADSVPAVYVSQHVPGADEIRAIGGGTIAEVYPTHIGRVIASSETDSYSPYTTAWNLAKPSDYAWSAQAAEVNLATNEQGVYETKNREATIPNVTITATRTASSQTEPVVVGDDGSRHTVVLLADIGPRAAETVTVRFEPNGGSPKPADQTLEKGERATQPSGSEAPVRDGYRFAGWFADEALGVPWDFESAVTSDMTLYAKWTPEKASVPVASQSTGTGYGKGFVPRTGDTVLDAALAAALVGALCLAVGASAQIHARRNR